MATVGLSTALVKVAGAAKIVFTARAFGMSDGLDAYLMAFVLPSFVSDTLAGSLSSALIPTFVEVQEIEGAQGARRLYESVLAAAAALLVIVTALLAISSPWVLRILASSFDAPKLKLTRTLFLMLSPTIPLSALAIIWRSILNTDGHFAIPAMIPAVTPLASIAFLLGFGRTWGVYSLAAGTLLGGVLEALLLAALMIGRGFPVMPRWRGRTAAIDQVARQYGPVIAGVLLIGGTPLIDQAIAGMLPSGSVAALNYGTRLNLVLLAIGPAAVSTAILPHFSKLIVSESGEYVRQSLRSYSKIILAITLPAVGFLVIFSGPLTRLFFERGQFTGAATELVATIQRYSLLAIPTAMVMALVLRLISSLKANYLLLRAAALAVGLNLALDLLLTRWMGIAGIALAGAIVQLAALIYLWRRLRGAIAGADAGEPIVIASPPDRV